MNDRDGRRVTRWGVRWRPLIVAWGTAVGVVTFTGAWPAIQPFVVLPFLLYCPGTAWVRLLGLGPGLTELTLGVALSLVLTTAVAAGMLYAGLSSPRGSLAVLLALTLVAVVMEGTTASGRHRRAQGAHDRHSQEAGDGTALSALH